MKRLLFYFSLLVMAVMSAVTSNLLAQSTTETVYIPGSESLNISNIINADTSVTEHRTYVLDRGAIYYIDKAFEITHSCTFTAQGAAARPPVLAVAIRADGSNEEWFFKLIEVGINVELNDLYLLSMRSDQQTLGWSRAIHIGANNISLKLRNVVFDAFTEAGIRIDGADFVKLDVQDCHFRNFIHSTSYFGGQPFLSNGNDHPDSTIFINNTFFACNSYLYSIRGFGPRSVFKHNTVVYTAVNPFLIRQADNLYIEDNLFYATHAWGGDPEQVIGGWFLNYPDTVSSSVYRIRKQMTYYGLYATTGPEVYYQDLGLTYDPSKRVNVTLNNDNFNPTKLVDFYNTWNDTVTVFDSVEVITGPKQSLKRVLTLARWINDLGIEVIDSLTNPSNWDYTPFVNVANNISVDPQFTDAGVVGHIDELVGYVYRIAARKLDTPWHYQLNFPPAWPIPENLAYSNTAMQTGGTDGFAIGDLNWFPDQKAQWLTNVETVSSTIPTTFSLSQNYPNPFNPETNIEFNLPANETVKLVIYNVLGQKVKTLINNDMKAGSYKTVWNGRDDFGKQVASGIYMISLESNSFRATKKMTLLK
ncbi:MAG: FlgD immunoglobulin-like domain containing protein [bacterium]